MHKYFEWVKIDSEISSWKSKGLYNKKVTYIVKSSKNQPPNIAYGNAMLFNGDPLKQNNVTYKHRPIVKIYIVHRLIPNTKNLFLPYKTVYLVQLNKKKNADIDKYKYSGCGIGFDSRGSFTHPSGGYGKNVIIFGVDMSNYTHHKNKTRSILVLGKPFIQGIDGITIYAEKIYSTNFTVDNKTFCLSLHYNGDSSYLFVNGKEIINFKSKDSEIMPFPLRLGNISK